jgi:hypothetical protein
VNSLFIKSHQVKIAISFKISFFSSQNQGAFIQIILKDHCILLKAIVESASHEISSAIITSSFFQSAARVSSVFKSGSSEVRE